MCMIYWDLTIPLSLKKISAKLEMPKSKAQSIERQMQPWESMNPYFCMERLVGVHPKSSLFVKC